MVGSDCTPYAAYALSRQLFSPPRNCDLLLTRPQTSGLQLSSSPERRSELAVRNPKFALSLCLTLLKAPCLTAISSTVSRVTNSAATWRTRFSANRPDEMAHAPRGSRPVYRPCGRLLCFGFPGEWKVGNPQRPKPSAVGCDVRSAAGRDLAPAENGFHSAIPTLDAIGVAFRSGRCVVKWQEI